MAAALVALALGGCDGGTSHPGTYHSGDAHPRVEATTDPQDEPFLVDEAVFELSTVDQVVTGTLDAPRPTRDDEFVLATLTSPDLPGPAPVVLRRDWAPRAGVSATIATAPLPKETVDLLGLPVGAREVRLASPDLGPGVAADEPGRIWAAYRAAAPSASDVELARAIVAGAKANRAETGGSKADAKAMQAALLRAFGPTATPSPAPTTSDPAGSVLPDGSVEAAPTGTVAGRVVLLLPPAATYRWVALRFPGRRFTVPTGAPAGTPVDVLTAVPLGQPSEVVAWTTEEPELTDATVISTVPALTAPQSVIKVMPQGRSVIREQGPVTQLGDVTDGWDS